MCVKSYLALEKNSVPAASLWGDFGLKQYLCMQHSSDRKDFSFIAWGKEWHVYSFLTLPNFCLALKDAKDKKLLK